MDRYEYQVRLVGGPLDNAEYETGSVGPFVQFPTVWFEALGDHVAMRSASGRIIRDFRRKHPRFIDVHLAVYKKQEGQQSPRIWRYVYSHSFTVYRCASVTQKGRRCLNFCDTPDGKCVQHLKE